MKPYTLADAEADLRAALLLGDTAEVTRLEAVVDELDVPYVPVSIPSAALWYAEQGLKVFPLVGGSKVPHKGTRGLHEATTDADQIRAWWQLWPDSNVAIATGHLVDVIDIDGAEGVVAWMSRYPEDDETFDNGDLPPIIGRVSTPRPGGNHLYVAAVAGRGNKAGLLPHVDYRGTGGYVVAPPSVTPQGSYRWLRPLDLTAVTW